MALDGVDEAEDSGGDFLHRRRSGWAAAGAAVEAGAVAVAEELKRLIGRHRGKRGGRRLLFPAEAAFRPFEEAEAGEGALRRRPFETVRPLLQRRLHFARKGGVAGGAAVEAGMGEPRLAGGGADAVAGCKGDEKGVLGRAGDGARGGGAKLEASGAGSGGGGLAGRGGRQSGLRGGERPAPGGGEGGVAGPALQVGGAVDAEAARGEAGVAGLGKGAEEAGVFLALAGVQGAGHKASPGWRSQPMVCSEILHFKRFPSPLSLRLRGSARERGLTRRRGGRGGDARVNACFLFRTFGLRAAASNADAEELREDALAFA